MVFETVLTQVLNNVLGDYVEDLDTNQLNVGIWGGDVELRNLHLKQSALNDLDLPVQTIYGKIGKLVLKIPWKNLYGSAFVINVEDVYLLAAPTAGVKYDAAKEAEKAKEYKKTKIRRVEEAKKLEREKGKKSDNTFVEKLITQIIKNLQLNIKNIHIRYEDNVTNPKCPFSLGTTLSELNVVSTDETWVPAITKENITKIFKIVQLEAFALYWNCNSPAYANLSHILLIDQMTKEIATKATVPAEYSYVVGPINASARLRLNQKPESDIPAFEIPKVHLNLDMQKLFIGVSKAQYADIIAMADSMEIMAKGEPFRQFRPDVPTYKCYYKQWWRFAYNCIIESEVRRVKKNWDWNHINHHRKLCKTYAQVYQIKYSGSGMTQPKEKEIEEIEEELDIFNIILIRQKVELEVDRLSLLKKQRNQQQGRWFGWMWGSGSQDITDKSQSQALMTQFKSAMTPEEKQKLYKAIGYQENATPAIYPEHYIDITASFLLRTLEVELLNQDLENTRVVFTELKGVKCRLDTRAAANSVKVHVKIDEFTTYGLEQDGFIPNLITSETGGGDSALLEISFETNPLDKKCDHRLNLTAQPLKIVYDAQTIIKIVEIFNVPSSSGLEQLSAVAGTGLHNIKELSTSGLQYAIEQHKRLDLNLDLQAPIILVSHGGKFTQVENLVIVNLGNVKIRSVERPAEISNVRQMFASGIEQADILQEMIEQSYDKFIVTLTDIQILLAQGGEDWKSCLKEPGTTDMHIVTPISLNLAYSKCLINDDRRLPLSKVEVDLPSIHMAISDARSLLLYDLISSIPLPTDAEVEIPLKSGMSRGSSMMLKYLDIHEKAITNKKDVSETNIGDLEAHITQLDLKFVMQELSVDFFHQEDSMSSLVKIGAIQLKMLECDFVQKKYVMFAELRLASIGLQQYRDSGTIDVLSTPFGIDIDDYLFIVKFLQVNQKSPEFHSTYKSCESKLTLEFATLAINLHQEGLLSWIHFATEFQKEFQELIEKPLGGGTMRRTSVSSGQLKRTLSVLSGVGVNIVENDFFQGRRSALPVLFEIVKFRLKGEFKELIIGFANDQFKISECPIRGVVLQVVIKNSTTNIIAKLQEIAIIDFNPKTIHKMILSLEGKETLSAEITVNQVQDVYSEKSDIVVDATVGCMRFFFLNRFISNMINFFNNFQTAQTAVIEASYAAAETAKQNMQDIYKKATKLSLNVNVKAPDIIVPVNSNSLDAIFFDLGYINVTNRFNLLKIDLNADHPVVIDRMRILLTDFKLSKIKLNPEHKIIKECVMLEPITLKIIIKRNLSSSWYRIIPDIDISGNIIKIEGKFTQTDYEIIMNTLNGNLAEGSHFEPTVTVEGAWSQQNFNETRPDSKPDLNSDARLLESVNFSPTVYTTLRLTFTMDRLVLSLYTGGSDSLAKDTLRHDALFRLAKFSLEGLSCKGRFLSDDSMSVSILLINCLLDDIRTGRDNSINRLIERTADPEEDNLPKHVTRSMIDVTFQKKEDEMFADVRIYSFTFIISMEYMIKLSEFFTQRPTSTSPQLVKVAAATKSTTAIKNKTTSTSSPDTKMNINLKIENPDIILVEHIDNLDTSALMFNTEIKINFRTHGNHQVLNGTIKDLELYTCNFNPTRRRQTKSHVLHPITISLAGSTPPGKGLHIELIVTDIHFCVSPATIGLANSILNTLSTATSQLVDAEGEVFQFSEMWNPKPYEDEDFWFLKSETGTDAMNYTESKYRNIGLEANNCSEELCIINMPSIIITLEAGLGRKTFPMLLLECSFSGNASNWSSQMSIEATLKMMMGYYNSRLALWEPLIEPVEIIKDKRGRLQPWELKLEMSMNNQEEITPTSDVTMDVQAVTSIDISSKEILPITVTKTCLEVLNNLASSFSSAIVKRDFIDSSMVSPFKFINDIGSPVTLLLENSPFRVLQKPSDLTEVILESGAEANLILKSAYAELQKHRLSDALILQTYSVNNRTLNVRISDKNCDLELSLVRADNRYFMLNYRGEGNDNWGVISCVKVEDGVTICTLRSIVKIYNHFNLPIEVYYMTTKGNEIERIAIVAPGESVNIPLSAVYTPTNEIFFSIDGYSVCTTPYVWKELQLDVTVTKILECLPKNLLQGSESFNIKAIGEMKQVYFENTTRHTMSSTSYSIHLRPCVKFKNFLPVSIICCVENLAEEKRIELGESLHLPNVTPGRGHVVIRIENYLDKEWSCRKEIKTEQEEFAVWTFNSYDSAAKMSLNLGMHTLLENGTMEMRLYCPFWMLNKTGLVISYKSSDDNTHNVLHHPPDYKQPILFSYNVKNFFSKKKASVRVKNGDWSDKFSLDVAGSSGLIVCSTDGQIYQIGVQNRLTYNGLTKQITFTPYHVIINHTPVTLEFQESNRPADNWIEVQAESCSPIWPVSEADDKLLKMRVHGTEQVSKPFLYTESHTTLLKLNNKYGGINVDIQITEGAIYINLARYSLGMVPAVVINHTRDSLNFWEKESVQIKSLKSKHSMLYTWENPSGPRILVWETGNKHEMENDLRKDGVGDYTVPNNYNIYWVSFLDGMQRVLLLTEDENIAANVQSVKEFELMQQELTVSLQGVGLSLLNNPIRKSVMYVAITSSGVVWEYSKDGSHRYKHFHSKESQALEEAFTLYEMKRKQQIELNNIVSIYDGKIEVDFNSGHIFKPHRRKIRRTFQTGLWLQQRSNPNQLQLHAKINRLQIDNQLVDCIFPVVLYPVPPPKSVALSSGLKPFAEMSIVQLLIKNSQIRQFKYFKILVQEFHVKVDLGFINALLDTIESRDRTEQEEKDQFLIDKNLASEPLFSHVSTQAIQEQKSFYDVLHFSPLKIHVSFSMVAGSTVGDTPNFLNVLLQGVGVTVTELQDVVMKLAYFEREYTFLTQKQLIDEASTHYIGQLIKQLYVLVLGLDVLGNPYGLVVGITKGVEDLFYEPFQGAIQGPGEFAEGLVLGVRSLFGHTVGGAAGAVSRITGAMGKGIAVLTFDDDYQRKRRDEIIKKPATVQEGIARSGKGLVMGVVDGVTGVFTKPISGAKHEGVGGFFKGLGKGAVGLVARPTSGVIDFASGSLDAVKRAAEVGNETVRNRPSRVIQADGLVRAYNRHEADGNKILMDMDKSKFSCTDTYALHYVIVEKKEVLLLTDQRLAYVIHNDIFGNWQVDWSITWQEFTNPAKVVPKGIIIPPPESKKKKLGLFGSNDNGKVILISDSATREVICSKIESLRGNF